MYEKHPDHFSFNGFQLDRVWHPHLERWHFADEKYAFNGIIAFTGGQAIGGTRWIDGTLFDTALSTVSGLAMAMADKAFAMELYMLDGVKSFIYSGEKTHDRLLRWGEMVESWEGRLLTSIDVGTNRDDMLIVGKGTKHVTRTNPSPKTAQGVVVSICAYATWRRIPLSQLSVYVTGVFGGVGSEIAKMLRLMGVTVFGKDVVANERKQQELEDLGVLFFAGDTFPKVDIYAPCAVGGILNERTIPLIKAAGIHAVIGCANCQLADGDKDAQRLHDAGIFYAVDYVVNGGGLLQAASDFNLVQDVNERIHRIGDTIVHFMEGSRSLNQPTTVVARNFFAKKKEARILTAA